VGSNPTLHSNSTTTTTTTLTISMGSDPGLTNLPVITIQHDFPEVISDIKVSHSLIIPHSEEPLICPSIYLGLGRMKSVWPKISGSRVTDHPHHHRIQPIVGGASMEKFECPPISSIILNKPNTT
jgi:hypothetical protein